MYFVLANSIIIQVNAHFTSFLSNTQVLLLLHLDRAVEACHAHTVINYAGLAVSVPPAEGESCCAQAFCLLAELRRFPQVRMEMIQQRRQMLFGSGLQSVQIAQGLSSACGCGHSNFGHRARRYRTDSDPKMDHIFSPINAERARESCTDVVQVSNKLVVVSGAVNAIGQQIRNPLEVFVTTNPAQQRERIFCSIAWPIAPHEGTRERFVLTFLTRFLQHSELTRHWLLIAHKRCQDAHPILSAVPVPEGNGCKQSTLHRPPIL